MIKKYQLTRTKNGVVTFKFEGYIESFDVQVLGVYETYERIRWAAITAGITLTEVSMEQLLLEARGLLE